MAVILDTVRGTNAFYLVVNGDPAAGAGTKAGIDSLAIGPTGITYQKTGLANTAWTVVATPGGGVSSLNTLTGAVILAAGTNITLTPVGNTITIDATAGTPVGDPNTQAYFDALGNLSDNIYATFDETINGVATGMPGQTGATAASGNASQAHGEAQTAGTIIASGSGANAFGIAQTDGDIDASGDGALAHGRANGLALLTADGLGAEASGHAEDLGTILAASGVGAKAFGRAQGGSTISAGAIGSEASGSSIDAGSAITATGIGSKALGRVRDTGLITAGPDNGAFAFGDALTASALILANNSGALSHGLASDAGTISSTGNGSRAAGFASVNASILASTNGSIASGRAVDAGSALNSSGNGSLALGTVNSGGVILASGSGSKANGSAILVGLITASDIGAVAHGFANDTAQILASAVGALAHGSADGAGADITASGIGSHAHGIGGPVTASGDGSHAHGTGTVTASASGALAHGTNNVLASGIGSTAAGQVTASGNISATGNGSVAFGLSTSGSITSSSNGSLAFGYQINASSITSSGFGSLAHGYTDNNSASILASSAGSLAQGYVNDNSSITASGDGAIASGKTTSLLSIIASGNGSIAVGTSENQALSTSGQSSQVFGDGIINTANFASAFGLGHTVQSYASMVIGRFGTLAETAATWVPEEAALALGNGTAIGAENIGYRLDKDGKQTTFAAERHAAVRTVSADTTLSDRTDRTLFVDTLAAAGAVTVTMPQGTHGQEFFVKDSTANATVNNVLFTPFAGDSMEGGAAISDITNDRSSRHFQFDLPTLTWYIMNLP